MSRSAFVAMDLRGFSASNQGCLFELRALFDQVPWGRTVLIVDTDTDEVLLSEQLQHLAQTLDAGSPNVGESGDLQVIVAGRSMPAVVDSLMRRASADALSR